MACVMEGAIKADDSFIHKETELFSKLMTENQVIILSFNKIVWRFSLKFHLYS